MNDQEHSHQIHGDGGGKPFSYDYDIFEDPELCPVGFNTGGNNTDRNNTDGNNTDGNLPAYKELNNQELNNKILNDKEHSHQMHGGGGFKDDRMMGKENGLPRLLRRLAMTTSSVSLWLTPPPKGEGFGQN